MTNGGWNERGESNGLNRRKPNGSKSGWRNTTSARDEEHEPRLWVGHGKGQAMADDDETPPHENVIPLEPEKRARRRRSERNPPPALPRGGAKPGKWTPNELGLPVEDPCPVQPVGFEGGKFYLIDSAGQFRSLTAWDFNQAGIQDLFAPFDNYPKWAWPRYGKPAAPDAPPPIRSFQADDVKEALFGACRLLGQFSPTDRLRGRGAWTTANGRLIYHAGNRLW